MKTCDQAEYQFPNNLWRFIIFDEYDEIYPKVVEIEINDSDFELFPSCGYKGATLDCVRNKNNNHMFFIPRFYSTREAAIKASIEYLESDIKILKEAIDKLRSQI